MNVSIIMYDICTSCIFTLWGSAADIAHKLVGCWAVATKCSSHIKILTVLCTDLTQKWKKNCYHEVSVQMPYCDTTWLLQGKLRLLLPDMFASRTQIISVCTTTVVIAYVTRILCHHEFVALQTQLNYPVKEDWYKSGTPSNKYIQCFLMLFQTLWALHCGMSPNPCLELNHIS